MYMKIISLSSNEAGYACAVASSIKKYYKNTTKTNFFDYLVVSIKSINQVLETREVAQRSHIQPLDVVQPGHQLWVLCQTGDCSTSKQH